MDSLPVLNDAAVPVHRFVCFGIVAFGLALVVLVAVLIDLADGLHTARRLHRPVESHKLRKTVAKILEYWRLLTLGLLADSVALLLPFYSLPYIGMALTLGVVLIEGKSLIEHAADRKSPVSELPDAARQAAGMIGRIRDTVR